MSPQRAIEPSLQVPMDAYAAAVGAPAQSVSRPSFLGSDARGLLCSSAGAWRATQRPTRTRRVAARWDVFVSSRGVLSAGCYLSVSVSPLALGAAPGCCEQQLSATRTWSAAAAVAVRASPESPRHQPVERAPRTRRVICAMACTGQSLATGDAERASLRCSCIYVSLILCSGRRGYPS